MASPSVASRQVTEFTSSSTTHNVTMPATVDAGDLLLALFFFSGSSTPSVSGWTQIELETFDSGNQSIAVYGKDAVGDEDSSTVNFATSSSAFAIVHVLRITGWSGSLGDVEEAYASGGSGAPNPPNLAPSGGSADYLWVVWGGNGGGNEVTAAPSDYSNLLTAASFDFAATAERALTASSENPGTFTASSAAWGAYTIAVPPESAQSLTGTRLQVSPTFGTGTVETGPASLTGNVFQISPSFGDHTVTPGAVSVTGTVFTVAPAFGAHEVDAEYDLTGNIFQVAPSFGEHAVEPDAVSITGSVFQVSPVFGDHSVGIGGVVEGQVFQIAPSFGTHTVSAGAVNVNGSLFQISPVFGTGVVFEPIVHTPGPAKAATSTAGGRAVTAASAGKADTNTGAGSAPTSPSSGSAPVKEN